MNDDDEAGPPPPRECPAPDNSSRCQATGPTQTNRPGRRAAATWAQRHGACVDRIITGRNPWTGDYRDWTDAELRAFGRAAEHLRALDLYGRWQVPESVRAAWRCRRCPCQRREVA